MLNETFETDVYVHYFNFDYGFMDIYIYVKTYQLLHFKYGTLIVCQL